MKTREEIDDLIRQWKRDPCWNLYQTEGFEEYSEELEKFEQKYWKDIEDKEIEQLENKAKFLSCSVEVVKYIERLENRIYHLEQESLKHGAY